MTVAPERFDGKIEPANEAYIAQMLGRPGDVEFMTRVHVAKRLITDLVRSYTGTTLVGGSGTLTLAGLCAEVLDVGERPLTAVESVTLDGTVLDASEYRWHRRGKLQRRAGWGDTMCTVEVVGAWGYPTCPADIVAVIFSATARLVSNPTMVDYESDGGYEFRTSPAASGAYFSIGELVVLNRYRRRTAS